MGVLYIDSQGNEKTRHSYSAGITWDRCPLLYKLQRIEGWREKDTKASLLFGRALESAIQFYHDNKGQGGVEEFQRLWCAHADNHLLVYTKKEGDWASLHRAGSEMMRLYAIRQPSLPMPIETRFQRDFLKEVFPGHERLGGIEMFAKLDAIPMVDPKHPMLPKIPWDESMGVLRPVIVDIKTMGVKLDADDPTFASSDVQLRTYAWMTGILDVAFMWFKKARHGLKKGVTITLLEDCGTFKASEEAIVAMVVGSVVYLVKDKKGLEEIKNIQGKNAKGKADQTKAAKERRDEWITKNTTAASDTQVSRQTLQFVAGRVSQASANDAGALAGNQIAEIAAAWDSFVYPNKFGVRYPHDDRKDPFYIAFIKEDNVYRDAMFEQKEVEEDDAFLEVEPDTEDEGETGESND